MKRRLRLLATLAVLPVVVLLVISCQQPGTNLGSIDLQPGAITYTGTSVAWGNPLSVSVPITNLASGSTSTSFDVVFHVATSNTFNPSNSSTDPTVGTITVAGIGANATVAETATLTMPAAPSTQGTNEDVYVYAVVDPTNATGQTTTSNDLSTLSNAAIVLAYDSSVLKANRSYDVVIETYGVTGGSSNPGISLFSSNGSALSYMNRKVAAGSNTYNSLTYTSTNALSPGIYYLAVLPVSQTGAYAVNVRTVNFPQIPFNIALQADPDTSNNGTQSNSMLVDQGNWTTYTTPIPTIAKTIDVGNALNWFFPTTALSSIYIYGNVESDWFTFTLP